jgi:hypothetical protein
MPNNTAYMQSPFNKSRKDKFLFVLNLPDSLKNVASKFKSGEQGINPDSLQFSIYGAVVPNVDVAEIQTRYAGQTLQHSSNSRSPYPPLTINFTVDNRFYNYWVLYSWLNLLNNDSTSTFDVNNLTTDGVPLARIAKDQGLSPTQLLYRSDISIFALDEYDKRTIEFRYTQAFPTELGGIEFNYRDGSEIDTTFSFAYSQFIANLVENVDNL